MSAPKDRCIPEMPLHPLQRYKLHVASGTLDWDTVELTRSYF